MPPTTLSAALPRLRVFFRENWERDRRERGCIIATDGEIIPMVNVARTPENRFQQSTVDFMRLCDLVLEKRLLCWAHSHPVWPAVPSQEDAECHNMDCDMVIYSCVDDQFRKYTTRELDLYRELYKEKGLDYESMCYRVRGNRELVLPAA